MMNDEKILILCEYGQNRSMYLKDYLTGLGYDCDTGGVQEDNCADTQDKIDSADIIITVHPRVVDRLSCAFNYKDKKVISIDVKDWTDRTLDGDEWTWHQVSEVYPELERQINQYLPL